MTSQDANISHTIWICEAHLTWMTIYSRLPASPICDMSIYFFLDKRNSKKCQTISKEATIYFFRCECVLISDPSPQSFPTRLLMRVAGAITDILTFFFQFTHSMTKEASSQPLTYWNYPMTPSVRLLVGPLLCSAFCLSVCQGREDALRCPIR